MSAPGGFGVSGGRGERGGLRGRWSARDRVLLPLLLTGFGACLVSGLVPALIGVVGAWGVVVGRLRRGGHLSPTTLSAWRSANLVVLALCVLGGVLGASLLVVALALVSWLQVHRAWTGRRAVDDRVALLLTLLLLLLACVFSLSPLLAPLFALWCILTPLALLQITLAAELEAEHAGAPPTGGLEQAAPRWLAPASVGLTVAFFFAMPRLESGAGIQGGAALVGFNEDVVLGDLSRIQDNPDVVLRVRLAQRPDGERPGDPPAAASPEALAAPQYYRGMVLDHFDGRRWSNELGGRMRRVNALDTAGAPLPGELWQEISLEPLTEGVLLGIDRVLGMGGLEGRLTEDLDGTWRFEGEDRGLAYRVRSLPPLREEAVDFDEAAAIDASPHAEERAALRSGVWRTLPPDLDPRIPPLAHEIVAGVGPEASPFEKAVAIESWLRERYAYTTTPEPVPGEEALTHFLFEQRRGHCEYFATALAVLLRVEGVQTRLVNGLYGGEWNEWGGYTVLRQRDAHTWVEAWMGPAGWMRFDATPASEAAPPTSALVALVEWAGAKWKGLILDYNLDVQVGMSESALSRLRWLRLPDGGAAVELLPDWSPVLLGVVLLFGFVLGGSRLWLRVVGGASRARAAPTGRVARALGQGLRLARSRGWAVPPCLPPVEAARWLAEQVGAEAGPLHDLAWLHYRVRYGGEPDEAHRAEAERLLRSLSGLSPRPPHLS